MLKNFLKRFNKKPPLLGRWGRKSEHFKKEIYYDNCSGKPRVIVKLKLTKKIFLGKKKVKVSNSLWKHLSPLEFKLLPEL